MRARGIRGFGFALLAAVLAAWTAPAALAQEAEDAEVELRPADLTEDHVGEDVVVVSRVFRVNRSRGGIQLFLDQDTSTGFQVIIAVEHIPNWGGADPEKRYHQGRNLRVRGELQLEDDTMFIRASEPGQIDVVPRRRRRR